MSSRWLGVFVLAVGSIACGSPSADIEISDAPRAPDAIGLPELTRLDLLPRFKRSIRVGSLSSYDRTGGNDDGFSGLYSFVRKDDEGLILAEIDGPGAIYRIWIFPEDSEVTTFDGYASQESREQLSAAAELFASAGENLSSLAAPPGAPVRTDKRVVSLGAGESAILFETNEPGRIVGLRC